MSGQIGGAATHDATAFGRIVDVAIDPLGRIWVADGLNQEIKVFRTDGALVRTIGQKGSGPTEFINLAGFDWSPEGTLWTVDGGNARFAVYDTAGQLVATHSRPSMVTVAPWPGGFDRAGHLADVGQRRRTGREILTSLVRYGPDLRSTDTLALPPLPEEHFGEITSGDAQNRNVKQAPVPFTATQIWAMDPEGYAWIARTDEYRLQRTSFAGPIDRVVEMENTARRVSRADKDQILRNYRWFEEAGGKLDRTRIPDRFPHLQGFFFDGEGHAWVFPTYLQGERPRIDIFNLDGRYLGQVQAPVAILSLPSPAIRGELVAAVARDGDGVDSIVLMRLKKPRG